MNAQREVLFSLVLAAASIPACREVRSSREDKTIPLGELLEIKSEAFKTAAARYVLPDTYIESHYKPPSSVPCPDTRQRQRGRRQLGFSEHLINPAGTKFADNAIKIVDDILDNADCARAKEEVRVEAVSGIRGVQLTPLSRNKCTIKFDFVESANPHAKLPASAEAIAERFETPSGHYWVVR